MRWWHQMQQCMDNERGGGGLGQCWAGGLEGKEKMIQALWEDEPGFGETCATTGGATRGSRGW